MKQEKEYKEKVKFRLNCLFYFYQKIKRNKNKLLFYHNIL